MTQKQTTDTLCLVSAGLSTEEAAKRLEIEGHNELPQTQKRTQLRIMLEVAQEPMFQLLIAAGVIYLLLGDLGEALILLAFVFITISISIVQETRNEKVLEALRDLTSPRALVIRNGEQQRIAGREVVRGDVVILVEGDRIPADALLIEAHGLQTNESLLTGEPVPVRKLASSGSAEVARPGGDDLPFIYSGTMVVSGKGVATVLAIGPNTQIGRIGKAVSAIEDAPTPLHAQTRRLVSILAIIGFSLSIAIVLLYGITRGDWLAGLLAGITLAMSLLPQEFPLILTVFMAMGAWRISQQRVLTRRAAAIETLGAATVLCTDKTGTLTLNKMTVAELDVAGSIWHATEGAMPENFHRILEYAILASELDPFDPMEKAFLKLGEKHLTGTEHQHPNWLLTHEYELSPDMLAMSHVWKAIDHREFLIAMKGAPEAVADLCHLNPEALTMLKHSVERMARKGMRVLGVASASYEGDVLPGNQHDFDFTFLGLVGLADPLRPGVREAVQECRAAGIKVAMITGDYQATAFAIAEQAGIDIKGGVISGEEMQSLDDNALSDRIREVCVFARIMPEQKLRLVNAFRANGEIVAMTGDGVNDAPSLKSAHIGIAMGGRGTDVAREASSLVLLDDDFGSIVKAVRLGRRIYDNVKKAMGFVLAVHVPIAGLSLLPLLFGFPMLFMPVHIAFLELVINPVCSIVFEAEPEEDDVMLRLPHNQNAPLFSHEFVSWSLLQGIIVLIGVGALFFGMIKTGSLENLARATAFLALVLANFALIVVNRSYGASIRMVLGRSNRAFWAMLAITAVMLTIALAVPIVRELFNFAALDMQNILFAFGTAGTVLAILESMKSFRIFRNQGKIK